METPQHEYSRFFVSYSGVKMPLKLVNPIEKEETENRNTYFCGYFDAEGRMVGCEKLVYGEVEFCHHYNYYPSGAIKSARISMYGDEPQQIDFPDSES